MQRRASLGRRVGEPPETEFPRHRLFSQFPDDRLPNVALVVGEDGAPMPAGAEEAGYGIRSDVDTVATIREAELPANYFAPVDDLQGYMDGAIAEAVGLGASDLLIDNTPEETLIRVRVDGRMRPLRRIESTEARPIMNILRGKAGLATTTSFAPEEGIYNVDVDGEIRPARVVAFRRSGVKDSDVGTAVAMRLPQPGDVRRLEELGFSDMNLTLFRGMLNTGNKMILIAGPMGAGKSTTAQGATLHVSGHEKSVWSVEDPVERVIPGVIQLSVNDGQGAGFDDLLPYLLRADYDSLFLGEIRNAKTAVAGVRQAKAGRQVITTIHANNNVTALLRLIDLAQDTPLSVMDAVRGVISQRLVSRLNPDWREGDDPAGRYKGRAPIHEVLVVNDHIIEAIMAGAPLRELKNIAYQTSPSTFEKDLRRLVDEKITDEQEAQRILDAN